MKILKERLEMESTFTTKMDKTSLDHLIIRALLQLEKELDEMSLKPPYTVRITLEVCELSRET